MKWENTKQFDIGLDFGFLNNRISGEIDFFSKKTKNLLLNIPVPATNGYTSITKNIGDMNNKGVEFVLNGTIFKGDFVWTSSFNISTYKNEVTRLVAPVSPERQNIGPFSCWMHLMVNFTANNILALILTMAMHCTLAPMVNPPIIT